MPSKGNKPALQMITLRSEDELAFMRGIMFMLKPQISVEVGVYEGGSAKIIKEHTKELHLFDTFGGIMSEHTEKGYPAGAYCGLLKDVQQCVGDAIYHIGDICKTKTEIKKANFVHIDLDVYKPLADCLPYFYGILDGVMLVSNYDDVHPGVKRAIDEFKIKFKHKYSRFVVYGN